MGNMFFMKMYFNGEHWKIFIRNLIENWQKKL